MTPSSSHQLARSVAGLSDRDLLEFWQVLLGNLTEAKRLEMAMRAAEALPATLGALRSLLAAEHNRTRIAEQLAGEPRRIVELQTAADDALREARIAGEAMAAVWEEEMLSSSEAARRLGAKPSNREKVSSFRRRSMLLGLPRDEGRQYLYPSFQIDLRRREIHPEVRKVNEMLDAVSDPWGVASWWVSMNARLDARPLELVGAGDEAVVRAAEALLEPLG